MIYGYCRISTAQQSIERQVRNILETEPKAKLYTEAYTGTDLNRPEWQKLVKAVKPGDTIIFDSVSRMSRESEEGFKLYESLYDEGIKLIFLKEPHINTDTYRQAQQSSISMSGNEIADIYIEATNKVLMLLAKKQIQLAFEQAQKEVDDLHERTKEGIKTARINGKQIGRPIGTCGETKKSKCAKETILQHSMDFGGSLADKELIKLLGISRNSFYKYKKELKL